MSPLLMSPGVEREVVAPGEPPSAVCAPEGLRPRVLPVVPRQLVRPREPPLAALPGARIRLLP